MTKRITCSQCRPLLPAYIAGSLAISDREAVDRHIMTCAACRQALADWREVSGATHYSRELVQPPPMARMMIWQSVQAAIAEGRVKQDHADLSPPLRQTIDLGELTALPAIRHPLPPPRRRPPVPWLAPVAALLIVVFAVIGIYMFAAHHEPPAGRVFVMTYTNVQTTTEGELEALDATTGTLLWHTGLLENPSAPIIAKNNIFITTDTSSASTPSAVLAFNPSTGTLLWQHNTGTLSQPPIVTANDVLLAFTATASDGISQTATLLALDEHSGRVLWQDAMPGKISAIQAQGDRIIVARATAFCFGAACNLPEQIVAVALADGRQLWQPLAAGITPTILITSSSGDSVLALVPTAIITSNSGSTYTQWQLEEVNPLTGQWGWQQLVAAQGNTGAVQDLAGVAVLTFPQADGAADFVAVNEASGMILWQKTIAGTASSVLLQQGAVIIGIGGTAVPLTQAFDPQTGQQLWQVTAWPLILTNASAIVRTSGSGVTWHLVALNATTGTPIWTTPLNDEPIAISPAGTLLFIIARPAGAGDIYQSITAVQAQSGVVRWTKTVVPGFTGLGGAP